MSVVYLIRAEGSGFIKIGWTVAPYARVELLQAGCPFDLTMVAQREGGELLERAIHKAAAEHRLRREWFHDRPEVHTAFAATPSPFIAMSPIERRYREIFALHRRHRAPGRMLDPPSQFLKRSEGWQVARLAEIESDPPVAVPATFDKQQDAAA